LSRDYGTKSLEEVLAPAIRAAEDGFVVTPRVALDWARYAERVARHEASSRQYLPSGSAPAVGDKTSHPALGRTLQRIAREGRSAFYEGAVATEIVETLSALGGLHALEDFAVQTSDYVAPIQTSYRGYVLHECPPNGQGLAALLIAGMLQGFDLGSTGLSEADRVHLLAEATKLAYRQRDQVVADPAFHPTELEEILSPASLDRLRSQINLDQAADPSRPDFPNHRDTVYVTVVDRDGTAVSLINSLFFAFGSGIYAPRSGVLLQNRGAGFKIQAGHRNAIAPRKRPLHTIIPAMVSHNGETVMSFGVMGGQYQAAGHAHILSQIVDRGDDVQQASDRPRSFCFDGVLSLEPTFDEAVRADLERRGHRTAWADEPIGGYQGIWIDRQRGVLFGGSDQRKDGLALGF
jgi:gamma-glutamyltranspeptidase/glutathione hydrolase